jgi:hypothetical protein
MATSFSAQRFTFAVATYDLCFACVGLATSAMGIASEQLMNRTRGTEDHKHNLQAAVRSAALV